MRKSYGSKLEAATEITLSLTTKPYVFQTLCDSLKESQVTEVDFTSCRLGSPAMEILGDYVREAIAKVGRLILNDNPLTSGTLPTDFDKDLTGVTSLCDTLKTSSVTELGLAKCRLGPGSLGKIIEYIREDDVAVTSINCLNNPLGDGVQDLIKVFEQTPRLRTLCGLQEGIEQIDWSKSDMSLIDIALLVADLKADRAAATVARLIVDSTGVPKITRGQIHSAVRKRSGPRTYTLTVGEEEIDLSNKNLGSADVALVAAWLQRPEVSTSVARLSLSSNEITGSTSRCPNGHSEGCVHSQRDLDLSGLISLCEAFLCLKNSIRLDLAYCNLSVDALTMLADAIGVGSIDNIDLVGNYHQAEPAVVTHVLNIASEVSRSRLRSAQVLAFGCALHYRMGADTAIRDMVDLDVCRIVASFVHIRHDHEALCSTLARHYPWYTVCVRGLISEGVPNQ